ncbi:hypothetical protein OHT59_46340 [Streptomyces sp. NBC_00243]|uniref:hypothetical protein n=1 Tax=Streptomyces sp. NBC_00243 TaxID=2975688 RepID=UPI002DD94933|nr:hypothetical protein [Streptomyces sp. NBC_00243]WRZ25431.1 hypothetical protein OHT59_46340 [Streptomyces sp. NBC_00243]
MRSIFLPKSLLAAALGGVVVLVGFGTQKATADQTSVVSTVAATSDDDAEARFLEMADLISQSCAPDVSRGVDAVASAAVAETTAAEPTPDSTLPVLVDPVPLTVAEECAAQRHQLRISRAFSGIDTATYGEMRDKLTSLKYPAARIHHMADLSGEPVARLDVRVGAEHLALEVTGIDNGVMVEAFGAPEGVSVTEVRLEPQLDPPTS